MNKNQENKIKLYCQNPQCKKPLIHEGEEVANIDGNLLHSYNECIQFYMCHKALQSKNPQMVIISNIPYISYSKAEKLAEKNKVKFNKLETKIKK
ncbi:hypothetical protein M0R19_02950 [Candidatus Pacearchaeota archaeon]|nr:hypothetical protein [Candidatus Pacearchaeota archaeon]